MADGTLYRKMLSLVPQQRPFRFIDEIIEVNDDRAVAAYRFKPDEWFYAGHFPGNPVTPGVILIETMAQAGLVVLAIHARIAQGMGHDEIRKRGMLFATADSVEFFSPVLPGERVIVEARKIYFKRGCLKAAVETRKESGVTACAGVLTGKEVKNG